MDSRQSDMIEKGRANLQKERFLKSFLCGMAVGLGASFVAAFITWFFSFKGMWLAIGLGLGLWAASAAVFFFFVFKPTNREVMKRLDRAGLDERMITMYELQGDDSYIAARQRADATEVFEAAVKSAPSGSIIKTKIPAFVIALACALGAFGLGWTVVTALSDYNVIPTGTELIRGDADGGYGPGGRKISYTVTYSVGGEGGGTIEGELTQTVYAGESTEAVKAIPAPAGEDGVAYYFKMWVDEQGNEYVGSPRHMLRDVSGDKEFTAVFEPIDDDGDINFGYYYDPNQDSDSNSSEDGEPNESNGEQSPPSGDPSMNPGTPGGGAAEPGNTIIDGETQYEELYEYYHEIAMDMLVNGTEGYPPELVEIIEAYFGIL